MAQKIGASLGSAYNADLTPGPYVLRALQHLDAALGKIQAALKAAKFTDATIILTAKHGQVSGLDGIGGQSFTRCRHTLGEVHSNKYKSAIVL